MRNDPGGAAPAATATLSPAEELMREHGVLERILLVHERLIARADGGADVPWELAAESAVLAREYIARFHERLEERFVFPRLRAAGKLVELVNELHRQHEAGRPLIAGMIALGRSRDPGPRALVALLERFIRMYRPHKAWEDTVVFPAFRDLLPPAEYAQLGARFAAEGARLFGDDGFERMVRSAGELERRLGIHDLSLFTPQRE